MDGAEKKFCLVCGYRLEVSAAFCPSCGRAQPKPAGRPVDPSPEVDFKAARQSPPNPYVSSVTVDSDSAYTSADERNWAVMCHLASLAGWVLPVVGNFLGPLIVWLMKKEDYPLVDDQGKESLNFQITVTLMAVATGFLFCVGVGLILLPVLIGFSVILPVLAAVKASQGVRYRYPFTIRLIT
jgi:uncharacterized protein